MTGGSASGRRERWSRDEQRRRTMYGLSATRPHRFILRTRRECGQGRGAAARRTRVSVRKPGVYNDGPFFFFSRAFLAADAPTLGTLAVRPSVIIENVIKREPMCFKHRKCLTSTCFHGALKRRSLLKEASASRPNEQSVMSFLRSCPFAHSQAYRHIHPCSEFFFKMLVIRSSESARRRIY
jgi:hypothetical protein